MSESAFDLIVDTWGHTDVAAHFRTDAPEPHPAWRGRIHWRQTHPHAFEEVS